MMLNVCHYSILGLFCELASEKNCFLMSPNLSSLGSFLFWCILPQPHSPQISPNQLSDRSSEIIISLTDESFSIKNERKSLCHMGLKAQSAFLYATVDIAEWLLVITNHDD